MCLAVLSKVQVTSLKEYTPSTEIDFDVMDNGEAGESAVDF